MRGSLATNSSTIDGNSASGSIGSCGRGIYVSNGVATPTRIQNSVVANSTSGGNCCGVMTSHGYNLSNPYLVWVGKYLGDPLTVPQSKDQARSAGLACAVVRDGRC